MGYDLLHRRGAVFRQVLGRVGVADQDRVVAAAPTPRGGSSGCRRRSARQRPSACRRRGPPAPARAGSPRKRRPKPYRSAALPRPAPAPARSASHRFPWPADRRRDAGTQTTGAWAAPALSTSRPMLATTGSRPGDPATTLVCTSTTSSAVFGRFGSVVMGCHLTMAQWWEKSMTSAAPQTTAVIRKDPRSCLLRSIIGTPHPIFMSMKMKRTGRQAIQTKGSLVTGMMPPSAGSRQPCAANQRYTAIPTRLKPNSVHPGVFFIE